MNKIDLSHNKVLKLTNVLICEILLSEISHDNNLVNHTVIQMENYVRSKGMSSFGPLIQKNSSFINDDGKLEVRLWLMRQTSNFINHVEFPYRFSSVIKVENCIYARFIGPGEKLKLAYDKINVSAFEEGFELNSESYTVFVDQQGDDIIADVFIEKRQ